ncbi:MAG: adenosine kinase [Rhizobiaceae bacterium]|nr:adenosine kinase [Rhizobiaceae bacterium]
MTDHAYDVLTIGNAIVDIIARCEDDFLVKNDITKGAMNLIDMDRAEALYQAMGPAVETSGGSAGNTAAGIASFGGKAAYIGKVADDHLGKVFRHDITAIGVTYETKALEKGETTARSMIFVTPDGERSMNTYLGACVKLTADDIDPGLVQDSAITYFEGYLWDPENAKDAIREAARLAHASHRKVAMTLSDSFCVDRYRDEFLELITSGTVDIVFANDAELKSLYQTSDLASAINAIKEVCPLTAVTKGEEGSIVVTREGTQEVDAHPIESLVDTTGAGDLYAGGFLFGLTHGENLANCARLGGLAAAEVIQHIGPRPQVSLKDLAQQNGFQV